MVFTVSISIDNDECPSFPFWVCFELQAVGAPLCAVFAGWERKMLRTPGFDFVSLFFAQPTSLMWWNQCPRITHQPYTNRNCAAGSCAHCRRHPPSPPTLRTSRRVGHPLRGFISE